MLWNCWLLVFFCLFQSQNYVRCETKRLIDISIQNVEIIDPQFMNTQCDLVCNISMPILSKSKYNFEIVSPSNEKEILRIDSRNYDEKIKNLFHFSENLKIKFEHEMNSLRVKIECILLSGQIYSKPIEMETNLQDLLHFDSVKENAPFYQIKTNGIGTSLMILARGYCEDGYYGPKCSKLCMIPPGFTRNTIRCVKNILYCRKGWTGVSCHLKDPCTMEGFEMCKNQGKCIPTYTPNLEPMDISTFRCECKMFWTGNFCEKPKIEAKLFEDGTFTVVGSNPYLNISIDDGVSQAFETEIETEELFQSYLTWKNYPVKNVHNPKFKAQFIPRWKPYIFWTDQISRRFSRMKLHGGMWRVTGVDPSSNLEQPNLNRTSRMQPVAGMWRRARGRSSLNSNKTLTTLKNPKSSQTDIFDSYDVKRLYIKWTQIGSDQSFESSNDPRFWSSLKKIGSKSSYYEEPVDIPQILQRFKPVWEKSEDDDTKIEQIWKFVKNLNSTESTDPNNKTFRFPSIKNSWKLATDMEPLKLSKLEAPTTVTEFRYKREKVSDKSSHKCFGNTTTSLTPQKLAKCKGYEWTVNCYEVPCILFKERPSHYLENILLQKWIEGLFYGLKNIDNIKTWITYTPLVLNDRSKVISVNFHASTNGISIPITEKLWSFHLIPLFNEINHQSTLDSETLQKFSV